MKPVIHVNDWHLGVIRTGGTTPATALTLRRDTLFAAERLLDTIHGDVVLLVNGDLFDTANVPLQDLTRAIQMFMHWLNANPKAEIVLPPGNHDISKNSNFFSSFDLFAGLLQGVSDRVQVPREGYGFNECCYVIPHMANQDLFELELTRVPAGTKYLFLHCNFDSGFAAKSDHSLNLSRELAATLKVQYIVIAHEHQQKEANVLNSPVRIVVCGNQFPTSVADCLGNDYKRMLICRSDGYETVRTWQADGELREIDWQELASLDFDTPERFIRVTGNATAEQAARVVETIAQFRKASLALVVTNAVQIAQTDTTQLEQLSLEQIQSFSVLDELMKMLTDEEKKVVTEEMEKL